MSTERDIALCALFEGMQLREFHGSQAMAKEVRTCLPSPSLAEVERIICEGKVRRLPLIDKQRGVVGRISLADLAQGVMRGREAGSNDISEGEISETLAAICSTHGTGTKTFA